jgi:hypothetical protein
MDQLEQLERLGRLRDSGALTEDEFQQQKAQLLATKPAAWRALWPWALAVAALAAVALYFVTRNRATDTASMSQTDSRVEQFANNLNSAQSAQVPQLKASPPPVEVNPRFSVAGGCRFAPELERAFDGMIFYDEQRQRFRPRAVDIAGLRLTPALTTEPDVGGPEPGDRAHISSVRIPTSVTWNGLQLRGLRASSGFESSDRGLLFQDSPARVRAVLQSKGIRFPRSGDLRIPSDGCQAALAVEARGTGSALVCYSWC